MRRTSTRTFCWTLALGSAMLVVGAHPASARNIALIIMDDTGVDLLGAYGEVQPGMEPPPEHSLMPSIDDLAQHGVLFRNVWSAPLCSATRATLMTGLFGFRNQVGAVGHNLHPDFATIPRQLPNSYHNAAFGKWHLTTYSPGSPTAYGYGPVGDPPPPEGGPGGAGFDVYRGAWNNVDPQQNTPQDQGYFRYPKAVHIAGSPPTVTDVVAQTPDQYLLTDEIDDAIAFVDGAPPEPWFMWLGLHAVHTPWQAPPPELHTQDDDPSWTYAPGDPPAPGDAARVHRAMLEAMDHELGRLLGALDLSDTTVILVGDNGSGYPLLTAINSDVKGSIYEGGINVPLIVAGDAVALSARGSESPALIHTVDVFSTIVELAGGTQPTSTQGVSFAALLEDPLAFHRSKVYTDGAFRQNYERPYHEVAVREARYKLIRNRCGQYDQDLQEENSYELYDLVGDPGEWVNLVAPGAPALSAEAQAAHDELMAVVPPSTCDSGSTCGLGFEIAVIAPILWRLRRLRPRT